MRKYPNIGTEYVLEGYHHVWDRWRVIAHEGDGRDMLVLGRVTTDGDLVASDEDRSRHYFYYVSRDMRLRFEAGKQWKDVPQIPQLEQYAAGAVLHVVVGPHKYIRCRVHQFGTQKAISPVGQVGDWGKHEVPHYDAFGRFIPVIPKLELKGMWFYKDPKIADQVWEFHTHLQNGEELEKLKPSRPRTDYLNEIQNHKLYSRLQKAAKIIKGVDEHCYSENAREILEQTIAKAITALIR